MKKKKALLEPRKVLCYACHLPIHINEFGGVMNIKGKEAFFHDNIVCLIQVKDAHH